MSKEKIENGKSIESKQPNAIITSYGIGYLLMEIWNIIFGAYVFFFYETEVGLYVWLLVLGYVIYALWNSFNDPLIGYIFDRPNFLWKKWGKRFPIIVGAAIPWFISMFMILTPPNVDPVEGAIFIFAWMVFATCLFDSFYSMFQNNHYSLFPDKFRLDNDRRKAGGIGLILGVVGTTIGGLIPPMFISYGDKSSYSIMAIFMVAIASFFLILMIPGIRETREMKNRYLTTDIHKEKESFFKTMRKAVKQRNFMIIVFITFIGDVAFACIMASIHYLVKYNLQEEASFSIILFAAFLLGAVLSIPLFLKLIQKMDDNRKMHIVGIILLIVFLLNLGFYWNLYSLIIAVILLGVGQAAFKVARFPCLADTLDEATMETGAHQESVYMGVQTFFMRFSLIVQAIIFAVVHVLTGFDALNERQSDLALFGIRLQAAIIPAAFVLFGLFVFLKYYDLTPEKTAINKQKLKELGL
ncbi:MAG: MFS transporter [Promethearchaeota archaeon]|nr:MAG: MFS transporter [Candidatus Lokiarchaeota archaeon]